MIVYESLYRLTKSMMCWHEELCNKIQIDEFKHSKANPKNFTRDAGDYYECISVYFNVILIIGKQAVTILGHLQILFQMKGI